jgi:hypothetical protein
MTNYPTFKHSAFAGLVGVAREDITPPAGIFFRNWGAAKHDAAEAIHRPLTLTAITFQDGPDAKPLVMIDADLGWFADQAMERRFNQGWRKEFGLEPSRFLFMMSHTHSAPPITNPLPQWKGGEFLPAYTELVYQATLKAARRALAAAQPATVEWHTGRCSLASNRDLRDGKRIVCGYNPEIKADDTVVVGRVSDKSGKIMATIVNYACHPTTLAWQNKQVSPDFVGAMRETMQQNTGAPALFLQGASGEMAPRYQYVGDTSVPDAHGRQLAFAALSTLADMEPAGQELVFDTVVESGAPLATWKRQPREVSKKLHAALRVVDLPLRDLPPLAEIKRQFEACQDRTMAERLRRKMGVRQMVGDGKTFGLDLHCWRVGDAIMIGCMAEAYSCLQQNLRARFPNNTIAWVNLVNGAIGYLAPAGLYDEDIYQVWQSAFERGSLELLEAASVSLIEEVLREL